MLHVVPCCGAKSECVKHAAWHFVLLGILTVSNILLSIVIRVLWRS